EGGWEPLIELSRKDALTTAPSGFDKAGQTLYLLDSRGRDKAALAALDLDSGKKEILFETERADITGVVRHPTEKYPQAITYNYKRRAWKSVNEDFDATLKAARQVHDGEFSIVDRTLDDKTWIIGFEQDDGPFRYYRFDADKREAEFLFTHRDELKDKPLAEMHPVVIESRDGLELVSYLTLPPW
ncbi:MAG: S9 family peptidase, partial [Bradymonadaceae bacterium]